MTDRKAPKGPQQYRGNGEHVWEDVGYQTVTSPMKMLDVERLRVPGGWLYRSNANAWGVFVPVPEAVGYVV
jgi:hypothetical protein